MTNSNSIYQDTTDVSNDVYLVYVLYRDGNIPHYVGATIDSRRPYSKDHKARQDHNITSVEIVQEDLSREDAANLEDQLINQYGKTTDGGTLVNVQGGGHGLATEETRAKISLANKGKTHTDETKQKMSLAKKGRTPHNKGKATSEETRAKMSLAKKGRPSPLIGRRMSDETKRKLSLAKKEYWAKRRAANQ